MRRLNNENINTPEEADRIFRERWNSLPHYIDWERFEILASHFKGGRYLDVGCFNSPYPGELTKRVAEGLIDAEVHAWDHAPETIKAMQQYFPKVQYQVRDITKPMKTMKGFDYIVCGEVLEHMEDPKSLVERLRENLRPGGTLAVSTPKEDTGSMTPEHIWSFDDEDIDRMFPGATVEVYKGMYLIWDTASAG